MSIDMNTVNQYTVNYHTCREYGIFSFRKDPDVTNLGSTGSRSYKVMPTPILVIRLPALLSCFVLSCGIEQGSADIPFFIRMRGASHANGFWEKQVQIDSIAIIHRYFESLTRVKTRNFHIFDFVLFKLRRGSFSPSIGRKVPVDEGKTFENLPTLCVPRMANSPIQMHYFFSLIIARTGHCRTAFWTLSL